MNDPAKKVLVVGGGPAGMEAALKAGDAGLEVVLVEKEPVLGGTLLRQHRSFPHWEDPRDPIDLKLQRLDRCPNVRVMPSTVVASSVPADSGFSVVLRNVASGHESREDVGAVVLATGFDVFDAARYGEYGYGIYPGVVNSLEFEDQLKSWYAAQCVEASTVTASAAPPGLAPPVPAPAADPAALATAVCGQAPTPKSVAFFKCVGSRDRVKGLPYCSKICCMYTAKQAGLVKDLFPDAKCFVFYMDYRAAGKGYEEFVRSVIEDKHVRYVRGRPSKVLASNGRLLIRAEDTLMGIPIEVEVDMVVLAAAVVPRPETAELARMFGASVDEYGFLEPGFGEPVKCGDRVFFAGACGFAVETMGALQQGAAAAAEVLALFGGAQRTYAGEGPA